MTGGPHKVTKGLRHILCAYKIFLWSHAEPHDDVMIITINGESMEDLGQEDTPENAGEFFFYFEDPVEILSIW